MAIGALLEGEEVVIHAPIEPSGCAPTAWLSYDAKSRSASQHLMRRPTEDTRGGGGVVGALSLANEEEHLDGRRGEVVGAFISSLA